MKKREGDLWGGFVGDTDYATVLPTTGVVGKDGKASLAAGVAQRAQKTWPDIQRNLGKLISTNGNHCFVIPVLRQPGAWTVSFPTRGSGTDDPKIIERSAHELVALADAYLWEKVYLPRVGCGSLDWMRDVRPILKDLLDARFTVIYDPVKAA